MRGNNKFFDERSEASLVKQTIVTKYFNRWSNVMLSNLGRYGGNKIVYLDLYSGPGKYGDGCNSIPIMILNRVIDKPRLSKVLCTIFNDANSKYVKTLNENIQNIPGIDKLKYYPTIVNLNVDFEISDILKSIAHSPTLLFADPWGYKGLTLDLINSVLQHWGCDCIFFFNYNRINPAINNSKVIERMNSLFGIQRANDLRLRIKSLKPYERELLIIEEMVCALKELGGKYVLYFTFKKTKKQGTSHYLFFVCKHFLGYDIMKGIMAKESTKFEQGVPTFTYNPTDKQQPTLFDINRPLDELETMLPSYFSERKLTVEDIFSEHSPATRYIRSNYKEILNKLENKGEVQIVPPASARPMRSGKRTLKDKAIVTFPRR